MNLRQHNYIVNLFLSVMILFQTGCTEYLEENPDPRVDPKDAEDFHAIVTGAYPGAWHLFTEIMSDTYRFYDYNEWNSATIESWFKPMYLWSDNYSLNLPVGPEYAWDSYYHSIYKANVVLEGIDDATGELVYKNSVKGEALLIRAYCHFMLVNLFAKHYDEKTATGDLGIPYAMHTETKDRVHYERDKVSVVYNNIEKDVLAAIPLLNNRYIFEPKFHFSKASAYAFLSRFYLYKWDFDKCILYSDSALAINSTVRNLVQDYNSFFESGDFRGFADDYFSDTKQNILLMNKVLEWNSYSATGFYANEFMNYFPEGDLRGDLFVFNSNTSPNWHVLKFKGDIKDGQQYSNVALFTVEEVLLNRAEAATYSAERELEQAVSDVNAVLRYRVKDFEPLTLQDFTGTEYTAEFVLLDRIFAERGFELCYEGYRWFDLKRYQIPITHATEYGTIELAGDDLRYVLQIPEKELSSNQLMVPNPR
jgi:starch-binding outer membrane protein, SusD/RagB family